MRNEGSRPIADILRERSPDGIIDTYVNGNAPELNADWSPPGLEIFRKTMESPETVDQLVENMDKWGVEKVLFSTPTGEADPSYDAHHRWAFDVVQKHPDRFALAVRIDPNTGVRGTRRLEAMVRNDGARAVRIAPVRYGKPINDKLYYPLLAKCEELGIPITCTTGIPGPRLPGLVQHPKYFDEVCYFFPELTIVSTHGGEPWQALLVKLMAKWPNLYHMISAFAPKYYPRETLDFLRSSRGRTKVMFATDYPLVSWDRAMPELADVDLPEESWRAFLHDNANRVFWGEGLTA